MSQAASVIEELEYVLAAGSSDRRTEILRRVTDLFLGTADDFNREQVGLFDDVLAHLIRQVETTALAELGAKLAPVANAPKGVIRSLARRNYGRRPRSCPFSPADGPRLNRDRRLEGSG
ncbi:MAG: hypothetical protein WB036_27020, partial [Pseudolabrys sp.]